MGDPAHAGVEAGTTLVPLADTSTAEPDGEPETAPTTPTTPDPEPDTSSEITESPLDSPCPEEDSSKDTFAAAAGTVSLLDIPPLPPMPSIAPSVPEALAAPRTSPAPPAEMESSPAPKKRKKRKRTPVPRVAKRPRTTPLSVPLPAPDAADTAHEDPALGDGLDHADQDERIRRIHITTRIFTVTYLAEKTMRRAYSQQTGEMITRLPHQHIDVATGPRKCTTCAAYGVTNPLLARLIISRLVDIDKIHASESSTNYRRSSVEKYMVHQDAAIDSEFLYKSVGENWFDVIDFAIGLSVSRSTDLAELALRLGPIKDPASVPVNPRIHWIADAAMSHLNRAAIQNESWRTIKQRLIQELHLRSAGSMTGTDGASVSEQLARFRGQVPSTMEIHEVPVHGAKGCAHAHCTMEGHKTRPSSPATDGRRAGLPLPAAKKTA